MLLLLLGCSSDSTISAKAISTHCWDRNGDGEQDADEDRNEDGTWDASDCQGVAGVDGVDGVDGAAGAEGAAGSVGAPGAAGLSCWDLNGDGVQDEDEDRNEDGFWDASDCQGSSGGISKGMIYAVYGSSGGTSSAVCDDNDDIMLNGGCDFEENCIPAHYDLYPLYNDDDSQPAEWFCALNCGSVTASGFCLTVDGP